MAEFFKEEDDGVFQALEEADPPKGKKSKPKKKKKVARFYVEKLISVIVWVFIAVLVLSCLNFLRKDLVVSKQLHQLQEQVAQQEKALENTDKNTENSGNFDVFNRSFILQFYNTKQEQQAYQDVLKKYFPIDTDIPINDPTASNKKILAIQLWEKKKQKNSYQVKYLIDYQLEDVKKQELLCYNVKEAKGKYLVQAIPYKQQPEKMTNNKLAKAEGLPQTTETPAPQKEQDAVKDWLKDTFFPKYIETNDKAVVKYMMKKPEVLGGVVQFKAIKELAVYPKDKQLDCYAVVSVTDRETKQEFTNHYHLVIAKDENDQYIVGKLTHTI